MKVGATAGPIALLSLISTWPLSGCLKHDPAPTTSVRGADSAEMQHAKVEAKPAGHEKPEHKHHEYGQHHDGAAVPAGSIKVGDKAPDFAVRTLDNKLVKLSELQKDQRRTKSGVVVLSFWCSTCHSCRHVEKQLVKLHKDYEGKAAVMALDANLGETAQDVADFIKQQALDLPIVLDPGGHTADLFGTQRTTTTVVIDGAGVLRYCGQFSQKGGGSAEDALRAVLAGQEVAVKTTPHKG